MELLNYKVNPPDPWIVLGDIDKFPLIHTEFHMTFVLNGPDSIGHEIKFVVH